MKNAYLNSLFAEVEGKTAAEDTPADPGPTPASKKADGDEQAQKLAQANREDLEGRVSARIYLQSLSKLGLDVPPRVVLTDAQVKAACDGASQAVRAVAKRRAA